MFLSLDDNELEMWFLPKDFHDGSLEMGRFDFSDAFFAMITTD